MNRLSSQPRAQSNQSRMTPQEYMIHKNIPIPQPAKRCQQDLEARVHKLDICGSQPSGSELDRLKKMIEDKNREIEFLKQTDNQSKLFTTQFQEMNQNHQQETKQLLEQIQSYKQRNLDLKSQLELYIQEATKSNQKYSECQRERDQYLKDYREYQQDYDIVRMQMQGKDMEIMALKERIQVIEKSHQGELNQLSQQNDYQKRSMLDTQIREITHQFNQDRIQYDNQIRSLEVRNQELESKNVELENKCVLLAQEIERTRFVYTNDVENYKSTMLLLQQENDKLQSEMQELTQFVQRYEEEMNNQDDEQQLRDRMRLVVLSTEIERLWTVIQGVEAKSENLQHELSISELACNQFKQQLQQERVKSSQYESDIRQLQYQQDQWEKGSSKQIELQNKCAMLTTEVERLNLVIRENEGNYQSQQSLITKLEIEISNYQQESMLLNAENDNLAMKLQQLEEEAAQQYDEQQQLKSRRSQELKSQMEQYSSELNRTLHNYNEVSRERDEYFQELQNTKRENEILRMQVDQKEENLHNLSEQLTLLDEKHRIETDELKKQNEFQRRSLLDQQIRDLTQKFNTDKSFLEGQIRGLQQTKLQLETKITFLQQELEKMQYFSEDKVDSIKQQLQASEKERINLLQEIKDYQTQLSFSINDGRKLREEILCERMRIVVLASEVDRLWHVIDDFTKNIKNQDEQYQLQNEKIKQMTATQCQYHNNICQLEQDVKYLQRELEAALSTSIDMKGELQRAKSEVERVKNQLYDETTKCYEFENKQKQLILEIEELYTQVDSYQTELTTISQNGLETSDLEAKFQAERMAWETQKYQLSNQLQDYEQRFMSQSQEIKRWTMMCEEKVKEIDLWKTKCLDSQFTSEYEELKREYDQQEEQLLELEQANLKLKSNVQSLDKQVQLLELSLQDKNKEIDGIYALMNKQKRQNDYTNKESESNRRMQQQLQLQIQNFEGQNQQLREQLQTAINQNQDLIQKIGYLENSLHEREQTIQRKTNELGEKIREMDQLKLKYEQKMTTTTTSTIIRNSSISRQKNEQENLLLDLSKQKIMVAPKNPRQAMAQLNTDFNQNE